jgi:hypothetical protein
MGLELLDLSFRVERTFGVKPDLQRLGDDLRAKGPPFDFTVAEFRVFLRSEFSRAGVDFPQDGEQRLDLMIADCLGIDPEQITAGAWMRRDLGID